MRGIILAILIIPGLLAAYFMVARPLLHKIPRFASFYDQADTFWGKVWALTGNSLTVLWGLLLSAAGVAFQAVDMIAAALGDPGLDLKSQVTQALKDNPALLTYVLMGISVVTILARFRSLFSEK